MKIEYKANGIWEITGFKFNDLSISGIKQEAWLPWPQYHNDKRERLDKYFLPEPFFKDLSNQLDGLTNEIKVDIWKDQFVHSLWPRGLEDIKMNPRPITRDNDDWFILKCPPGFSMGKHVDNREVLGVIVINVEDNPEGSGTQIGPYTAPNKKGSGVFFLNSHMTSHRIENKSDSPRYVFYSSLSVWPLRGTYQEDEKWKRFLDWNRREGDG